MKLARTSPHAVRLLEAHSRHIADGEDRDEALIAPENPISC